MQQTSLKEMGVISAYVEKLVKRIIPRLQSIKKWMDEGGVLSATDTVFVEEHLAEADGMVRMMQQHPQYAKLAANLAKIYQDICEKALKNEQVKGACDDLQRAAYADGKMNSEALFNVALGLQRPWEVRHIAFVADEKGRKELHLVIGYLDEAEFDDGEGHIRPIYDTVEHKWQHLNFFEHHCFILCNVPRIQTPDGRLKTIAVPWARQSSGFTLLFEVPAMRWSNGKRRRNRSTTGLPGRNRPALPAVSQAQFSASECYKAAGA